MNPLDGFVSTGQAKGTQMPDILEIAVFAVDQTRVSADWRSIREIDVLFLVNAAGWMVQADAKKGA